MNVDGRFLFRWAHGFFGSGLEEPSVEKCSSLMNYMRYVWAEEEWI